MAKQYGDDLRRKFLLAYDQGEGTLEELAGRFLVSVGWAKKISAQRNRSGQAERVVHRPGRKLRAGPEAQRQVLAWMASKPDLNPIEKAWAETQTNASRGKGTNQRNTRSGHHRRASTHHSSQCKSLLQTHPLTVYSKTENTLNMDFIAFGLAGKLKIVPQ